jgi:3-methyladenine DNA glycosylase/8-oxoguanine DNA glycosylase
MPDESFFEYGEKEIEWLKTRDPELRAAIERIGPIHRNVSPDLFTALVNTIVGQQISSKALATVWGRMLTLIPEMTPQAIGACSAEELQACGISFRKTAYIKDIANTVLNGELDLHALQTLPDDEVCERLSRLKGIGVWTAEMLMIFSMQRKDVLSWGDLAIIRGLRMLYRHRKITPALFAKYKRRYSPYATVASLYLWAIASGACPGLTNHAPKTDAQKKRKNR